LVAFRRPASSRANAFVERCDAPADQIAASWLSTAKAGSLPIVMDKQVIGAVGSHDDPMAVGASQAPDGKPQNRAHHRAGGH
jgi:hypothetical protein